MPYPLLSNILSVVYGPVWAGPYLVYVDHGDGLLQVEAQKKEAHTWECFLRAICDP